MCACGFFFFASFMRMPKMWYYSRKDPTLVRYSSATRKIALNNQPHKTVTITHNNKEDDNSERHAARAALICKIERKSLYIKQHTRAMEHAGRARINMKREKKKKPNIVRSHNREERIE